MKRLRVYLYRHPTDRMLDLTVCRNCGKTVLYGKLINYVGHDSCEGCFESLKNNIDSIRENDYNKYSSSDHMYLLSGNLYNDFIHSYINKQERFLDRQRIKLLPRVNIIDNKYIATGVEVGDIGYIKKEYKTVDKMEIYVICKRDGSVFKQTVKKSQVEPYNGWATETTKMRF